MAITLTKEEKMTAAVALAARLEPRLKTERDASCGTAQSCLYTYLYESDRDGPVALRAWSDLVTLVGLQSARAASACARRELGEMMD